MISVDSDGDVRIRRGTQEDIVAMLDTDEDTGELLSDVFDEDDDFTGDPCYWGDSRVLIIRGDVVTPKPVTVQYELG